MTFLHPLGLLALLALPVILGLHFFRQQKKSRVIGGLHLWDFARLTTPAGRHFERLRSSLPLLFQLLSALLLALLLAGLDFPLRQSVRHYSIIIDDSISMQARAGDSTAAKLLIDAVSGWAGPHDRFTLIAASNRPLILAGPAATKTDVLAALAIWSPHSSEANFDDAINLAAKFGVENGKIVLLTDDPATASGLGKTVTVWGVGRAAVNDGILFADRFRATRDTDKIVANLQRFGGGPTRKTLTVFQGKKIIASKTVDMETSKPVSVEFELPVTPDPIRLSLAPGDSFTEDDTVILEPVSIKPVKVFISEGLPQRPAFLKAATAVPDVLLAPTPSEADLVFTNQTGETARARRTWFFPDIKSTGSLRSATGRDLITGDQNSIARNLALAGVTWSFDTPAHPDPAAVLRADISYTSIPLLYTEPETSSTVQYHVNLALDSTNIFRQPAWPILILNAIEECRSSLPGLSRTNFRAGEDFRLHLEPSHARPAVFALWRDDEPRPAHTWQDKPPAILSGLTPGTYTIRQGTANTSALMARFRVNLFNEVESDLRPMQTTSPDIVQLTADTLYHTRQNDFLFYAMLTALAACITLGWIYHDAGH